MAPGQAASRQPDPAPCSVGVQGLQRVGRARRYVTAHRRTTGTDRSGGSHRETGQARRERHRCRKPLNNSPSIDRSSAAENRSSEAETPRRYSPSASTSASSRASSRSVSRMRRRTRLRTTAVPTDFGTARWTRVAPGEAQNDTLNGPRRILAVTGDRLCVLRSLEKPLTLPVGSVPYDVGLAEQRGRSAFSFWLESRVSYAFSLCWAEKGVSLEILPRYSLGSGTPKKPPLQLMLWTNSGTESTVGLAPRRDNHASKAGNGSPGGCRGLNPNKAHRSNISYRFVIRLDLI